MKLFNAILSKVRSLTDCNQKSDKKYASPPPENSETILIPRRRKKRVYKYAYVVSRVDSSPPRLDVITPYNKLQGWQSNFKKICIENEFLVAHIRKAQLCGGKVDCHWSSEPQSSLQYYRNRVDSLKRINRDNLELYKRIVTAIPRVEPTESLRQAWKRNKQEMIIRAENAFVLFPPVHHEVMEDAAFASPPGVKRPRVYITVGFLGSAIIGELCFELFTDVCPKTCRLFTELVDGDTLGFGYVGTSFFRKVPHLYWSGGDVTHDNGFGCYAQRGLSQPIGAENYHFSHSMPGLLSMRVTRDDEVCGIFNITFKALPQFDLHNIVFGRVIRPSTTYNTAQVLGQPLSSYPVIKIVSTRRRRDGKWVTGEPNTRLVPPQYKARLANSRRR